MIAPPGVQRFTASGVLGRSGVSKRVYFISSYSATVATAGAINLYNATAVVSGQNFLTMYGKGGSDNNIHIGEMGMQFPNGCYVALSADSGITYTSVVYNEEL